MTGSGPHAFVAVVLVAAVLAGCSFGGFFAHVVNRTDRSWTVTVVLVAAGNGTEAYNRTLDVPADDDVGLDGFPPWKANFTAIGRLEDGRTTNSSLTPQDLCGSCGVSLYIDHARARFDFYWSRSVS